MASRLKRSNCLNEFFPKNNKIFMYLLALFIVQNLQKIFTADPKMWGCPIFGPKMVHLPQPFSLCKISKKSFQRIQSYEDVQLLGIKWPIWANENFFRKPVNEPCSFHSFLSTCQKLKSDINLLVKYWRLGNKRLRILAVIWEPSFSQACNFCIMLMNHKNFHITQIQDKANDMIFLKSPKTMFLSHFWLFLVIFAWLGFFPKNSAVTYNYIWAPNSMLSFRKTNEPIPRKLTDKRKDERKDRRTLFFRTLPAEDSGPKHLQSKTGLLVSTRGHVHIIIAVWGL